VKRVGLWTQAPLKPLQYCRKEISLVYVEAWMGEGGKGNERSIAVTPSEIVRPG